jgi:ankyrin repeat protein
MIDKQELLYDSLENNDTVMAKKLIFHKDVNIIEYNNYALRIAARKGETEIVKILLSLKEIKDIYCGDYLFTHAIENGHLEVLKLLFEDSRTKTQIEIRDYFLNTAAKRGYLEIIKLLLNLNLSPILECNTPISEAFKNQHNHIVDFLWSLKIVKETLKKDNLELYNILQKQDVKNKIEQF